MVFPQESPFHRILFLYAIRIPVQDYSPVPQERQHHGSDPDIVFYDLGFFKVQIRIEDFIQICNDTFVSSFIGVILFKD